jgi:hypothetical protein
VRFDENVEKTEVNTYIQAAEFLNIEFGSQSAVVEKIGTELPVIPKTSPGSSVR